MYEKPVNERYKEYANKIVGTWYNRIPEEILTFHFLEDLTEEAELQTLLNGKFTKATYNLTLTFDAHWHFLIRSQV